VTAFRDILVRNKVIVVVRQSRGKEISAACGQLRAKIAAKDGDQSVTHEILSKMGKKS
jgi:23S rRNA (adenine2503-C2)-methyltransferase